MKNLALFCLPLLIFAHPHFLIDTSIKIQPTKIQLDWKFDKINSKLLFFEFDTNKNRKLDKNEVDFMIQKFFLPLKTDNFHLMIQNEEDELEIAPQNIQIEYLKRRLHVKYDILVSSFQEGVICNIDATSYYAFNLLEHISNQNLEIQKSQYDFCIGVAP